MIDIAFLKGIGIGLMAGLIIAMMIYRLRIMGLKKGISNIEEDINRLKKIISDLKNNQRKERKIGDPSPPTGWEKDPDGVFTTINKMLEHGM